MNDIPMPKVHQTRVDEASFRRACGQFATGVTIMTTCDENGAPVGLTVNSFTSASLDPPLVLWTIGPRARSFSSFVGAKRYAVHVLHSGQEALAKTFASSSDSKFDALDWVSGQGGIPILPEFAVCLECSVHEVHPCGNQRLMIGRVTNTIDQENDDALVYFRSTFREIGATGSHG